VNALPEYAVGSLFPGVSHEFPDLLSEEEPAWLALERLGDFLSSSSMPLLDACIVTGVPLPVNFFLMPDGSVRDDLAVACNRATKGRMAAVSGGELLSDVSVLCAGSVFIGEGIRIGKGVAVEAGALVKGPAIIGDGTEVRQGAYLRGNVFAGRNCVLGHTTEVKHSIFLDNAKAGHFAYVGDSIFGRNVNLGAGTKMANLKFVSGTVRIRVDGRAVDTGRRKLGAILGDNVQTGCNSVTNPGTVVGPDSVIAPNTTVMPGCYPGKSIIR
jgi:bifunctional N-acetylglucosamine-1-phosphate-uridyltransferase/glucosamine-1-phosphate-acetyltransferase GlmU-like protein